MLPPEAPDHLASSVVTARRLSQAIAEGDGISVLVEIQDSEAARAAQAGGAEGLVVRHAAFSGETDLPLLAYGPDPTTRRPAPRTPCVLVARRRRRGVRRARRALHELGIEFVVRVSDDEELAHALEHVDPEIVLLTAERAEDEQAPLDRLLELLPDVPAGKLAIAELADASRQDVEELERAGVDAVLVAGDVEALVGDAVPDV